MEKEKETVELTDAALTEVVGGIKTEPGIWLEHGELLEVGSSIFMYNGPTTFLPSLELIPFDLYEKIFALGTEVTIFCQHMGTVQQPAGMFAGCGITEPFPYPIR